MDISGTSVFGYFGYIRIRTDKIHPICDIHLTSFLERPQEGTLGCPCDIHHTSESDVQLESGGHLKDVHVTAVC